MSPAYYPYRAEDTELWILIKRYVVSVAILLFVIEIFYPRACMNIILKLLTSS